MATLTALEKRAQRKARGGAALDMNLVSLIDVFTILIFFLMSGATGVETMAPPKEVKLPLAKSEQSPKDTLVLVVGGQDILADGRRVASVAEVMAQADEVIPGLKTELDALAARPPAATDGQSDAPANGPRALTIMADKDIPYSLLRKVMVTCARANFSNVSFAVRRRIEA
jgi:biopolymer transport protein ExbD